MAEQDTGQTTEVMLTESMRVALDHALADARACLERDGDLCPFSIMCTSDGFEVTDHPGDSVDDVCNSAKALIARELPEAYVFAYDGYIDVDAGRLDAIVCEVARRGDDVASQLAQNYVVEEGAYRFSEGFKWVSGTKTLYPKGTKPIVSGLVQLAREREDAAGRAVSGGE